MFYQCKSLQSVIIPQGVKIIEVCAFQGCINLQSISIPESVKSIYTNAFNDCTSLKEIAIPNSVTEMSPFVFNGCSNLQKQNVGLEILEILLTRLDDSTLYGSVNTIAAELSLKYRVAINPEVELPLCTKENAVEHCNGCNGVDQIGDWFTNINDKRAFVNWLMENYE